MEPIVVWKKVQQRLCLRPFSGGGYYKQETSCSGKYGTPEGTFPAQLFIRTEFETRKLKWQSKVQKSRLSDLLYR